MGSVQAYSTLMEQQRNGRSKHKSGTLNAPPELQDPRGSSSSKAQVNVLLVSGSVVGRRPRTDRDNYP